MSGMSLIIGCRITLNGQVRPLDIMEALEKENIECRPIWKPMHMQPFYEGYDFVGEGVSEKIFKMEFACQVILR